MIIMTLAAAAMAPAPVAEVPEIVVIARRLDALRVWVGRDPQGRLHCGMDGTTGHERLDKRLCKSTADCVRKGAATTEHVRRCVAESKPKLLERIRRELEGKRR